MRGGLVLLFAIFAHVYNLSINALIGAKQNLYFEEKKTFT